MSLLSYNDLVTLIDDGVVTHSDIKYVNGTSIDIQLGKTILIERTDPSLFQKDQALKRVVLRNRDQLHMIEWDLVREGPYILYPGEFILAHSKEMFNLPNNISAKYVLKSSMARIGLEHLNAGWADAGWHGSVLTLELKNMTRHHEIVLNVGDLIGQMIFFSHEEVPHQASYATRGRYNNDKSVSGAKLKSKAILFGDNIEEDYVENFNKEHPMEEQIASFIPLDIPKRVIETEED